MQTQQGSPAERRFTGRHMLIVIVCFFATVIGVNIVMAVLASRSWSGLVVKNSYVASQHFNETLADVREQKALGWKATLIYENGRLAFSLLDRDGRPVHVLDARVSVSRPTHEREDRTIDLEPTSRGYEAATVLAPGIWNAEVITHRNDGSTYRASFRLTAKTDG